MLVAVARAVELSRLSGGMRGQRLARMVATHIFNPAPLRKGGRGYRTQKWTTRSDKGTRAKAPAPAGLPMAVLAHVYQFHLVDTTKLVAHMAES